MAKRRSDVQRHEQRGGQLRCAIYTRKSTEEGLDQEFNSLDAQREACEAYIVSQRHEGWLLLPDRYDDGGISGGTMERPGLQRLLADVREGKVDVIVVYKVDRLTRALSDFAKIVDTLDAADASFVSITQAFNTTTSMGRLTLNVLLSFAQFEREVISERVRDKVAASKAKGMFMGGCVPLGYDAVERKLVVNAAEAATVRHIFQRYLNLGSVRALIEDLTASGMVTKQQHRRDGSVRGGIPFTRGCLYHLLKNRTYLGFVHHHEKVYPGEHDAIVTVELFDAVQVLRKQNAGDRRSGKHYRNPSLLAGMVRDRDGRPMSPSHTVKRGRRLRYYVSNQSVSPDNSSPAIRVPAAPFDTSVITALLGTIADTAALTTAALSISATDVSRLRGAHARLAKLISSGRTSERRPVLMAIDLRVIVHPDRIAASCCRQRLLAALDFPNGGSESDRISFQVSASLQRRGHELKLRLDPPGGSGMRDHNLIGLIVRAHAAREQLLNNGPGLPSRDRRELARVARASYLAPDIVAAIFEGRQPRSLGARIIVRAAEMPICWKAQRQLFGFV